MATDFLKLQLDQKENLKKIDFFFSCYDVTNRISDDVIV